MSLDGIYASACMVHVGQKKRVALLVLQVDFCVGRDDALEFVSVEVRNSVDNVFPLNVFSSAAC